MMAEQRRTGSESSSDTDHTHQSSKKVKESRPDHNAMMGDLTQEIYSRTITAGDDLVEWLEAAYIKKDRNITTVSAGWKKWGRDILETTEGLPAPFLEKDALRSLKNYMDDVQIQIGGDEDISAKDMEDMWKYNIDQARMNALRMGRPR